MTIVLLGSVCTNLVSFFFVAVVSGTNVTVPGSGVIVMGGDSGTATAPFTQQAAGYPVVEVHAGEAAGVQWQIKGTSDVSEFLRKMNAERMHLEQQIGREEETAVHKLLKEQVMVITSKLLYLF